MEIVVSTWSGNCLVAHFGRLEPFTEHSRTRMNQKSVTVKTLSALIDSLTQTTGGPSGSHIPMLPMLPNGVHFPIIWASLSLDTLPKVNFACAKASRQSLAETVNALRLLDAQEYKKCK